MKFLRFNKTDLSSQERPTANKKRPVFYWLVFLQIFLFAIAAGLSVANPYMKRQRAMEEIHRIGGEIHFSRNGSHWFSRLIGSNPISGRDDVVAIDLSTADVTDETLELLSSFPNIESLSIHGPEITPKGFALLQGLKDLRYLMLINCPQIESEELESIVQDYPRLHIDRRGSALLGITGKRLHYGCVILTVRKESSASQAGLREGDVIFSFGGTRIGGFEPLVSLIAKCKPGDEVSIRYYRGRRRCQTDVTLGSWTEEAL